MFVNDDLHTIQRLNVKGAELTVIEKGQGRTQYQGNVYNKWLCIYVISIQKKIQCSDRQKLPFQLLPSGETGPTILQSAPS